MNSAHHTAGLLLHYTLFIVCGYHLHINQSWFFHADPCFWLQLS